MLHFLLVLFASVLVKTVSWAFSYFGLSSFEQLVFHIKVPLEGTNKRFLVDWFRLCFLWGFVILDNCDFAYHSYFCGALALLGMAAYVYRVFGL